MTLCNLTNIWGLSLIKSWTLKPTVKLFVKRVNRDFHTDHTRMIMFCCAFIESVLSFSLVRWFGHTSLKERKTLNQVVKWSSQLTGESLLSPASLYIRQLQMIASSILNDDSHPLHSEFQLLPSGCRFLVPKCKTKHNRNSFVLRCHYWIEQAAALVCTHSCRFYIRIIYLFIFLFRFSWFNTKFVLFGLLIGRVLRTYCIFSFFLVYYVVLCCFRVCMYG